MAVATFAPIVDLLTRAGVVAPGTQTFDVRRYLDLAAKGTRWDQLPGNTAFPARKNVLLSTTAPCSSNSGAMYLSIASYVANADTVVGDADPPPTCCPSSNRCSPTRATCRPPAGNALTAGGQTAIYDTLEVAYGIAGQQIAADPDRFTC